MYELTTPQMNIWNLQRFYEGTSISNNCGAILYDEKRDHVLLNQAINKLIEMQEGMRLQFCEDNDHPLQYIAEYQEATFSTEHFADKSDFEEFAQKFALQPFELINSPMNRFVIFDVEGRSGILLCASHLISDAWAISIIAQTVSEIYDSLSGGEQVNDKKYSYTSFIDAEQKYLGSSRYEKDKSYWAEQYPERPEICSIKPNSAPVTIPAAKRYTTNVSSAAIDQFSAASGITQAVLFEAAITAYLARINSENHRISLGVPVLNRSGAAEKNAVGMCISTTPLTIPVSGETTMEELCAEIKSRQFNLFRHHKFPYSHILHDLHERYGFSGNLYDVIVSFQNAQTGTKAKTKWYSNGYCEVGMEFHIDNRDGADSYTLNIDYQTELFPQEQEIVLLVNRILHILQQIISNPELTLDALSILPEEESQTVVYGFNQTEVPFSSDKCVHELFSERAEQNPDKIALVFEDQQFTYRQLDEMSDSLAHALRAKGVHPGDIVPIISKRSWHIIVAMLGTLKAGAAYMPVDPTYPKDRIDYMFETAQCSLALTYGYFGELDVEAVDLAAFDYSANTAPVENLNNPEDLCYIIFTSGSTGKPKGVSLCHRNVVNYANPCGDNIANAFIKNNTESIVSTTNIIFDIFVTESIMPLVNGLTIYFANDDEVFSQRKLAALVEGNPVDVMQTTPTKMRSYILDKQNLEYLRKMKAIVLGGEALPVDLYLELRSHTDAKIFNIYGPAETTVWSTNKCVEDTNITIGKSIANTQVYILDKRHRPLPVGVAGELCISGDGVGKGYLNRPELTAERFIPNPFIPGKTMYCTGDLARWRTDGEIEYLGRMDTQVKIRGLRIELGEIESVMSGFEGIQLAAVTDKKDETGRQYLVGYYTAEAEIDEKALRQHLSEKLPKYMVPNYFVHLDEMPMTASGKTDRKNLPVPEFTEQERFYIAPETPTEQKIASMWEELLHTEQVGKTDDFFDLGGDSLVAIHLLTKLETTFDAVITVKDILEHSTLEQLALWIDQAQSRNTHIPVTGMHQYPLLPQQMAIYTACNKDSNSLVYNMPARIALSANIDRQRLKACILRLPEIHPELKTAIRTIDGTVYAVMEDTAEITVEEFAEQESSTFVRPFDLSVAPLIRVALTENAMLFDMHHIIADGGSLSILLQDLAAMYSGAEVTTPKISYADYADYFSKVDLSEHKAYFKEMLKCDFEPMALPECKNTGKTGGESKLYHLNGDVVEKARKYAKQHQLTDTMLFLGAFGILLSKYTGREDVLTTVVLTNRVHPETRNVTGMFVNTLPIMLSTSGSTDAYFASARERMMNLFEYQEIPFLSVAEAVGMRDKNAVNTSFVYQDGEKQLMLGSEALHTEWIDTQTSKFDLTFELTPKQDGCAVRIEYNCGKYEESLIDRLFDAYLRILEQLNSEKLSDISVLSEKEYRQVIFDFNDTAVDYPRDKCVHELFSEQAKQHPDKIALVFEDQQFTYRQLDEMSNSLAHELHSRGVRPGDIVPIISKRSWHVIVAMLGVLKAGGGFMLIDYHYPTDRISYLVQECLGKITLSYGTDYPSTIMLEEFDFTKEANCLNHPNLIQNAFCVLHTSGSTGVPKVAMLTHANILHYIEYSKELFKGTMQAISTTTITFDAFLQETIVSLYNNVPVIMMSEEEIGSQVMFENVICRYSKSFLFQTPTKLRSYIQNSSNKGFLSHISTFVLGGEIFTQETYEMISQNTDADRIFNIYGPTETTVCVCVLQIHNPKEITIGTPISNTQIYILDKNRNLVPVGVAGELCISGDGVGKGYLNRPELTAERFIPNPFIPGKTMYCTGDLARWRADGEIEYLGRMDTQVKIRGLRIELGEIESVMSSFEGVQLSAVTDKKDETGRQYLVGYYTAETEIDEKALRQHLSEKLPKYMVPNYFVHLDEMPMTASGKTDRKNLPMPEFSSVVQEYVAPETEMEVTLCNVLSELFAVDQFGVTDDFFDMGGDSLRAIEYVAKAHTHGIEIALQNVFDYPTVRLLGEFLSGGQRQSVQYAPEDFICYEPLFAENVMDEAFVPVKKSLGNVLLTGATGFLGAHILDQYMKEEQGTIYCLVRGGESRLAEILRYYFGDGNDSEFGKRIVAVDGDITRDNLSDNLNVAVQTVIHTAATVKHYGTYDYFHKVNVQGTQHVAAYAKKCGAKLIHVSTLSVSGNSLVDAFDMFRAEETMYFDETSLYIGQPLDNVYIHSKFESERVVLDAMLAGMDAKIVRVGNLTNRASDFKFQPNYQSNAFLTRVKAGLELGCLPDYLLPLYSEFSPIDQTAEGVIKIAQYADKQTVFHLNSNRNLYFDRMIEILNQLNISMKVVDGETFRSTMQELAKDERFAYIYEAFQNDMDDKGNLVYDSNIRILNDFTLWFLKKLGFEWAEVDLEYVKGYVEYFRNIGYLEV